MKAYHVDEQRPQYVLQDHEDELYHEQTAGELSGEPEYCVFAQKIWVFNRAMRWLHTENGAILCYSEGGDLLLTGEGGASRWHSDPENRIEEQGDSTLFAKQAKTRRRDCAVLPALQFNVDQHPRLELAVEEADAEWQLAVLVKGRGGAPILTSGWQQGLRTITLDLREALARRGYTLHYPELHLAIGTRHADKERAARLRFRLRLLAEPAVIPCLPIIRTAESAAREGPPVAALVLDGQGQRVGRAGVSLRAILGERQVALEEKDGVWMGSVRGLVQGDCDVTLEAKGAVNARTTLHLRMTDGQFFGYDDSCRSLVRGGQTLGPLSGSYAGTVFFRDAGLPTERMLQTQGEWDVWDRTVPPGEHWHYWEALTAAELEERFAYLQRCGWNLLHLCQHWGVWERLDAGGHLAPHGAEQLALFLRTAARHEMAVIQALSHYPYGQGHHRTPPFQQHYDAGFKNEDWTDPQSPFTQVFHRYLGEFTAIFREETALLAMTTSGEGDIRAGSDRVNSTFRFVTSQDRNHLFVSEPIGRMEKLPHEHYEGWQPAPYGSRLYWVAEEIEPEHDLGIEYKLVQLGPVYIAEGSWPCPPLHANLMGYPPSWCGTEHFRTRVRDSLYLGLTYRSAIILTWDELLTEDERIILNQVRQTVDWRQPFQAAPVVLRVDSNNVLQGGRQILAAYERYFAAKRLMCRYTRADLEVTGRPSLVIDARQPYQEPALPPGLADQAPLQVSSGYTASYLWSEDRRTLLAYLCNSTGYLDLGPAGESGGNSFQGRYHRLPKPADFSLRLQRLPDLPLRFCLYDLCGKASAAEGQVRREGAIEQGQTAKDYLLVIRP